MLVRQGQLACGAQHAVALYAAQFAHLDFERLVTLARRQLCAHQGARHLDAHSGIGRAADYLQQLARARIHLAHAQAVGIRVLHGLFDFGHHNAAERLRHRAQLFNLQASHRQRVGQLLG